MPHFKQSSLLRDARAVAASHKKGLLRQALEVLRMKQDNPALGASDYYAFRLYDPEYLGLSRPRNFVGWREESDVPLIMNERSGVAPAWDKFVFAIFAHAYRLPVPRLRAVYRPECSPSRALADVAFDTLDALAEWLRVQSQWPVFAKPCFGGRGSGCYHFTGYESASDRLTTRRGDEIAIEDFVHRVVGGSVRRRELHSYKRELGYLFQDVLLPHPRIAAFLGNDKISGVRVILVQDESGVEIVSAEWKMALGVGDTDNIRDYSSGNMSAEIEVSSGRLGRVVNGLWPHASLVDRVPTTQREIAGFLLPDWSETIDLCKRAALMLPLMRMQHWDVALTDRGPCLLEVNDSGSLAGQIYGNGILTPRVRALLQRHGNPRKYPLSKRLAC